MRLTALVDLEQRVWNGERIEWFMPALAACPPESQVAVARILHGQHLLGEDILLPAWRSMKLDVEVRLVFTALELVMQPVAYRDAASPVVLEALMRTSARDVRPESFAPLVRLCLSREELRFHQHALTLLDEQAGRVDPTSLEPLFEALLDTALAPLAVERLTAIGGTVPAYAALQGQHRSLAAIRAHGVQGDRVLLLRLAEDASLSEPLRLTALAALGQCARREDVDTVLAIALQDSARLAAACFAALVQLRHRGIFLQAEHLVGVFELARYAPGPLAALTAHLTNERREFLEGIEPEDARWLVWMLAFDRPGHGLESVLLRLLESRIHGIRAMALDLLKHPFCESESTKLTVESRLLALRRVHPTASRAVLEVVGGEQTCQVLLHELDDGRLEEAWLPVLVGLLPDGDARLDELEATLDASSPYAERLWSVPRGAGRGMVRLAPGMDATRLFVRLCAAGSLTVVPDVLRLLREHTVALCDAEPGHSSRPVLSDAVSGAIDGLAKAVHRRGGLAPLIGIRREWDAPVAFRRWLLTTALEDLEIPERRAVLVRSVPVDGMPATTLIDWSRADDPELKRDILERMGEHSDVVTLAAYAVRAMSDEDARVARAGALAAIEMRCPAAVPALLSMLDRPRMELKRVAARGIGILGDGRVVGHLVRWLGRHDNAGFRSELLTALRVLAPTASRGLLVAALHLATGRKAVLLKAAIGELDQPEADVASDIAERSSRTPFLFRAHAFTEQPCGRTFDSLLDEPLRGLSSEAEEEMLRLIPALFEVLLEPSPAERRAREARGRAARHFLMWSAKHDVPITERESRILQLRRIPTLPMGRARWDALRGVDAVLTLEDLNSALRDCEGTATRTASMTSMLEETGLESADIHEVVSATGDDRGQRLTELLEQRPVSGPRVPNKLAWPTFPTLRGPTEQVEQALEAGTQPTEHWPWAPDTLQAVVKLGGRQRPSSHRRVLLALAEQSLDELDLTPDRARWLSHWPDRPSNVDAWARLPARADGPHLGRVPKRTRILDDLLPDVVSAAPQQRTLDAALELLMTPGEERRGLRALERFPGRVATDAVRPFLDHRALRAAALRCFRRVAPRNEVREVLRGMLDDRDDEWVRSCTRVLGFMRDPDSARVFCHLLQHRSAGVRRAARDALLLVPEAGLVEVHRALRRARPDRQPDLRALLEELQEVGAE